MSHWWDCWDCLDITVCVVPFRVQSAWVYHLDQQWGFAAPWVCWLAVPKIASERNAVLFKTAPSSLLLQSQHIISTRMFLDLALFSCFTTQSLRDKTRSRREITSASQTIRIRRLLFVHRFAKYLSKHCGSNILWSYWKTVTSLQIEFCGIRSPALAIPTVNLLLKEISLNSIVRLYI